MTALGKINNTAIRYFIYFNLRKKEMEYLEMYFNLNVIYDTICIL